MASTKKNTNGINNVFIIPSGQKEYIIYLPVQGILFKANAKAVNLFYEAISGNAGAQSKLGLSGEVVQKINQNNNAPFPDGKKSVQFKPTTVNLFLTTDCSMQCIYCYASGGEKATRIKQEYIEIAVHEIIQNALSLKKKNINVNYHGGGDIGVVWDLVEQTTDYINRLTSENNLKVYYSAGLNGILSDSQREWVVKNLHSVTLSLDGDKEIQNYLRPLKNGRPSFDHVDKTLRYFDSKSFEYAIRSTITFETVVHLERIVAFICENYNVRKIKAEPVYIQGRASHSNVKMPDAEEFIEHFLKAKKIANSFGKELLYSGARFETFTNSFCKATGASFGVTPEGHITSCYEVLDTINPDSNIFFYGKIENGKIKIDQKKLDGLAAFTVNNKDKCEKCFAKFHCAGDCPVKSVQVKNNPENENYRCIINRELTKHQLLETIEGI